MTGSDHSTSDMRHLINFLLRHRARLATRPNGYGAEVLFAGWVELSGAFREPDAGRSAAGPGPSHNFTRSR
jgi:hypothetical protein